MICKSFVARKHNNPALTTLKIIAIGKWILFQSKNIFYSFINIWVKLTNFENKSFLIFLTISCDKRAEISCCKYDNSTVTTNTITKYDKYCNYRYFAKKFHNSILLFVNIITRIRTHKVSKKNICRSCIFHNFSFLKNHHQCSKSNQNTSNQGLNRKLFVQKHKSKYKCNYNA